MKIIYNHINGNLEKSQKIKQSLYLENVLRKIEIKVLKDRLKINYLMTIYLQYPVVLKRDYLILN